MAIVSIFLYQDGTLRLFTPWTPAKFPKKFTRVLQKLPNHEAIERVDLENLVRFKLPIGWPFLPAILTALHDDGWEPISKSGCGPLHPGDVTSIFNYENEDY